MCSLDTTYLLGALDKSQRVGVIKGYYWAAFTTAVARRVMFASQ